MIGGAIGISGSQSTPLSACMALKALSFEMAISMKIFILTIVISFQLKTHLGFSIVGAIFSAALLGMSIVLLIHYSYYLVTTHCSNAFKCFKQLYSFSFCY